MLPEHATNDLYASKRTSTKKKQFCAQMGKLTYQTVCHQQ